ncbi:MAG: hypothetical protein ACM3OF_06165 [Gemmatimonas sp.]
MTTGTGGITPAFPAQWFTAYFGLSPVNQLVATVISAMRKAHRRQLSACIGAPGPHDFAVRRPCRSSVGTSRVHRIPLRVRDDAYAPSSGTERRKETSISGKTKEKYFCGRIWTTQSASNDLRIWLFRANVFAAFAASEAAQYPEN